MSRRNRRREPATSSSLVYSLRQGVGVGVFLSRAHAGEQQGGRAGGLVEEDLRPLAVREAVHAPVREGDVGVGLDRRAREGKAR